METKRKPIIGIAGLTRKVDAGIFVCAERAFTGSTNVNAILRNGGIPVILPASSMDQDTEELLSCCDGILFPGGEDVTPWYYGEEPGTKIGVFRPEIDRAWIRTVQYAVEHKIPIMGICKGHQTINVALGGSLYQDMSDQAQATGVPVIQHLQHYDRSYLTHHVEVEEGSRLAEVLGVYGKLETNSMHHQSVKKVGQGLRVSATAPDGTIEALEDEEGLILTLQWHPEDLLDSAPVMNRLFRDLVNRAAARMND